MKADEIDFIIQMKKEAYDSMVSVVRHYCDKRIREDACNSIIPSSIKIPPSMLISPNYRNALLLDVKKSLERSGFKVDVVDVKTMSLLVYPKSYGLCYFMNNENNTIPYI